jgi:hypothetical protein
MVPMFLILKMSAAKKDAGITNKELLDLEDTVRGLIAKLEEASKQQFQIFNDKVSELRKLISVAEKKIDEYSRLANDFQPYKKPSYEKPGANFSNESPSWDRVVDLYSRGSSAQDIAHELGILTGEVELIISLNKFQDKPLNLQNLRPYKAKNAN